MQGAQDPANRRQQKEDAFRNTSMAYQESQKVLARIIAETPEGRQFTLQCSSNSENFNPRSCQQARFQLANTDRYQREYVPASDKFRDLSKILEKNL